MRLKSRDKGFDIEEALNFHMEMEIPSYPWTSFGFKYQILLAISSIQISKDEILD